MKHYKIKGVANFRELGGIETTDGRKIKDGFFFRTGQLGEIKEKSKAAFEKLNIKHIIDYRAVEERAVCEDYVGNSTYHFLPAIKDARGIAMEPEVMRNMVLTVSEADAKFISDGFTEIYGELPFDNVAYSSTLKMLNDFSPILLHCTAGKDRTGVGCALILKALGVSNDAIIKDFMLSNKHRLFENYKLLILMFLFKRNKWARFLYKKISFVHEYNIQNTLSKLDEKYPNFNDYLLNECGITPEQVEKWKEFYLDDISNQTFSDQT